MATENEALAEGSQAHRQKIMSRLTDLFPDSQSSISIPPLQLKRFVVADLDSCYTGSACQNSGTTSAPDHGCQAGDIAIEG